MADLIVYVNPDATGNNDGTTPTDAYTSLSLAESSEQKDLVTATDTITFICAGTVDSTDVAFVGWNTSSDYDITIKCTDDKHDGRSRDVSGTGYQLSSAINVPLRIAEDHVAIDGLDIKAGTNMGSIQFLSIGSGSNITVKNCIFHNVGSSSSATYVILASTTNLNLTLENVVAYGVTRLTDTRTSTSVVITNCTFWLHNDQLGVVSDTELTCNHTYCGKASGSQQDFWTGGAAPSGAYNASSDTTARQTMRTL